jgi:hypothetical protein
MHDDQKPSLNVTIGENGKVIFYCHVCPAEDRKAWCSEVLTKLGLGWADLQPFYSNEGVRTKKSAASEGIRPDMQARVDRAGDTYFGMLDKVDQVAWWHGFYDHLCKHTPLTEIHQQQLERRGLDAERIKTNGYFSLEKVDDNFNKWYVNHPQSPEDEIRAKNTKNQLRDVLRKNLPREGLFVPIRDADGHILTVLVRRGGQVKYQWPNGSTPIPHVPLGVKPGEEMWITEGPLKADVAYHLSGLPIVGVPGVGSWHTVIPLLEHWGTKRVVIAFDADRRTNQAVKHQFESFVRELEERAYEVLIATWPEEAGNGIDDALLAGHGPEVRPVQSFRIGAKGPLYRIDDSGMVSLEEEAAPESPPAIWKLIDAVDNNFIDHSLLTLTARIGLAIYRHSTGGKSTVSQEALAEQFEVDTRTIRRAVAELKHLGLLTVKKRGVKGKSPNVYALPEAWPAEVA